MLVSAGAAFAQDGFFVPLSSAQARIAAPGLDAIEKYGIYQLRTTALRDYLAKAPLENRVTAAPLQLAIPLPDGTIEQFTMAESPILAPAVAAQHPDIKTYTGQGTMHPAYSIRLSLTSSGFDAIILGVDNSTVYVTKITRDSVDQRYAMYFARDVKKNAPANPVGNTGKCSTLTPTIEALPEKTGANARPGAARNNTGATLRTFRLAVAATKGFTNQKGGGTVSGSLNALVGYVNRMNAVYRRELSVAFTLVSGTNTIFTDQADGGYVDGMGGSQASTHNQGVLDRIIRDENYDVGHVLGYSGASGDGVAVASSACVTGRKADAYTGAGDGSFAPVFEDQTFSHELGHQFSMSHTFNSVIPVCTTREATTSAEPGAGTTIMSYGYTCSDQNNPAINDNYETPYQPFLNFHTVSYQQAVTYIATLSCFTSTSLNNAVPVISNFPANMAIPKSTPFSLSATATDADAGDRLTYSWEGTNIGLELPDNTTLANTTKPPFFRSYEPVLTGTRMYPRLEAILTGTNYAKGDKLPSIGIATTHVLTVRDNVGGVTFQSVTVTVDGNSGPFLETTNLSGTHPANSLQNISWSVANTTAPPVNCASVNILLSTDGGQTFPITLLADAPNTGNASIRLPDVRTTQGRIKIASSNNIFFDISNANFTIGEPIVLTGAPIVDVNSNDPSASEGGSNGGGRRVAPGGRRVAADPGFIQFERSSGQGILVVNYEIEGTATNGVDFATLPTSITFADGQTVVTEELDPLPDDITEDDETIVITLLDSEDYDPNPDQLTTTLTIKDRAATPMVPFSITGATTVSCLTVTATRRELTVTPLYVGLNGQPVSFSIANEMLPTTAPGPYTLGLYVDNPTITLKAIQTGTAGEASFAYNWLATCNTSAVQSKVARESVAETSLIVRVLGNPVTNGRISVDISGAAGQPLQLILTNIRGMVISSHRVEQPATLERYSFDIGRQHMGTLLLHVSTPTQAKTVTVLKAD
jgi:hypothetical protein